MISARKHLRHPLTKKKHGGALPSFDWQYSGTPGRQSIGSWFPAALGGSKGAAPVAAYRGFASSAEPAPDASPAVSPEQALLEQRVEWMAMRMHQWRVQGEKVFAADCLSDFFS